ncbi:DEAD/DEAH box helicase, putative [Perkinsus marinus ATCC 50983]|uniref:DEAD/DEAH box helicase, putative n=2 Tax=Perkinsus marinus (strain ATCC 50983 / TXsc) TaxID=423536 RepID=C5LSM4_PERM5|nr:DEAD/DEAH box helicase, putative [Perkinsus marinus ATCC 50983]EER00265.1 DEAD/DEAH box helicase, putative [Perkinsus marinus ATCC 50983]|eukprot:XP_002767547.1 DEAD/DEAH box helicase, putative [Perkinsus marinus ATCC 50983]
MLWASSRSFSTTIDKLASLDTAGFLSHGVRNALRAMGFTGLTSIQEKSFEPIVKGQPFIGRARTGTGKTLAYLLPITERLRNERFSGPGAAIVVLPSRELSRQVASVLLSLLPQATVVLATGGHGNMKALVREIENSNPEIVIGTPGRIVQLVTNGAIPVGRIRIVVLDEADAVLKDGTKTSAHVESLLAQVKPFSPQTVVFSASMSDVVVRKVSEIGGANSVKVDLVASGFSYRQPATVRSTIHRMIRLPERANLTRYRGLCHVLRGLAADSQALIFANTTKEALAIARHPAVEGLGVKPLHSEMPQSQRDWLLNSFRGRRIRFLVTTDLLSRGIDLPGLQYVILFRPPEDPTAYVHRAGRTGRAGDEGEVITLYDKSDWPMMQKIMETTKQNFENSSLPTEEELRSHAYAAVATEILSVPSNSWKCLEAIARDLVTEGKAREVLARVVSLLNTDAQLQPKKSKVSLYSGVPDFTAVLISDFDHTLYPSVEALQSRVPCPLERVRKAEAGWVADVANSNVDYLMKSGVVEVNILDRVPKTFDAEKTRKAKGRGVPWRHARELTKLRAARIRHKRESRKSQLQQSMRIT